MSGANASAAVAKVAEDYYDSDQADRFYFNVWGGEDIHIGLYEEPGEPPVSIATASRRTVERMASQLRGLREGTSVLDIGAGYGGAARWLAENASCSVTCLNLSQVQNETNERLNREQQLDDRIRVLHGNFEDIPQVDAIHDVVWSQDAILHSGNRRRVFEEVVRVLAPGGQLIFTDPMQSDDCPPGVLQPVLDRIHLESLGSVALYREILTDLGMREVDVIDLTVQLRRHYSRVADSLRERYEEMCALSTKEYVDRMLAGLAHWVEAADAGYLAWGILHFVKAD